MEERRKGREKNESERGREGGKKVGKGKRVERIIQMEENGTRG